MLAFKMITVATLAAVFALSSAFNPSDECQAAYRDCRFRFEGYRDTVPTFKIRRTNDFQFTPAIVSKVSHERIGIVNSNGFSARFVFGGSSPAITKFGSPRFVPTAFKPYAFRHSMQSGIGHQTLHGNQLQIAKGKCIKVVINFYQILGGGKNSNVVTNINDSYQCIVFKTR